MPKAGITVEINQGQDLHEKLVNAIMDFIETPVGIAGYEAKCDLKEKLLKSCEYLNIPFRWDKEEDEEEE